MFSPSRVIMLIIITAPLAGAPRVVGQVSATANVQVLKPPIDPSLSYSTYLATEGSAVGAWDSSGNACIAFNSTQVKLRSDGSVVYSNSNFAGPQTGYNAYAVAIDSQGSCYVAGLGPIAPTAGVFQTSAGSQQFVMKFDASGAITYATYLGGSGTDDRPAALAVDSLKNVYLTGSTNSSDFPTARAFQPSYGGGSDAFIAVLNPNGTALVYSTYLGGSDSDGANSVAVDGAGNAVVVGGTSSADFPTRAAFQPALAALSNAFVVKLDPAGNLVYSSFLGGTGTPQYPLVATSAYGAAIDSNGNAYLTGSAGDGFPLMNPLQTTPNGAFITKINPSGSALLYSTYLGVHTTGVAIAVDSSGQAYIGGIINAFTDGTPSPPASLPLVSPIQSTYSTMGGFVSVLDATGSSLLFSTFLGGGFSPEAVMNLAVDSVGNIYASGQSSLGFPIVNAVNGTYEPDRHFLQPTAFKIAPVPGPVLASPTTVDLKSLPFQCFVGTSCGPDGEVLVANAASTGTITISGITVAGDYSQTNNCPQTLLAATSCVLSVTFTPTAGGTRTGTITIADDAPGNPHVINLIGIGTNSGLGLAIPSGGSGSATVSAGQSASYTLSIGGAGMSGTAALSCTGAPTGASCSVPASQSLSSTTASTITVTVSTASRMLAATSSPTSQRSPWLWAFFVLGIVAIRERSKPKRSRLRHVRLVLPLFLASCGGGGGPQQNPNGTPAGNYTLTVAATSGSVTEKVSLTLTVQ